MSVSGNHTGSTRLRPRLQAAVHAGLQRWQGRIASPQAAEIMPLSADGREDGRGPRTSGEVLSPMPRRAIGPRPADDFSLPHLQRVTFKTSRMKALGRLVIWLYLLAYFFGGNLWDRLWRRNTQARRAVRLRQAFEKAGGTLIKFGQQMAMRIDLLPWAYTVELSRMLDRVPPFPFEQAVEIIERSTGKPWQDSFAVLDPDPIGSASVANVYQGILKNGERVAIKVRRPGIGETFMADFKVFDWLLDLAEFLTMVRPGYTRNIRREFQTTLLEELDFVQEARFQEMFRRSARRTGRRFFTAPRIIPQLTSPEVIVQKYAAGMWLWEVMAGVEQKNAQALARMSELNINPQKVASRLMWVNYWGMQENLFFHADPHPANVIVQRNSKLSFVDFGSCGSFNREQRAGLELIAVASSQNDAEGMARGTLKLFEPLPPVDVKELLQEAEGEYTRVLAIFNSKRQHTEWWERTSVRQWMSFFKFSREHNIAVAIHTLRMVRATLLYDTIAVRIHKETDRFQEYLKFRRFRERQARNRVTRRLRRQVRRGLDDTFFVRLEEAGKAGEKLLYRTQGLLSSPRFNFGSLVGKWVFAASAGIRLAGRVLLTTLLAAAVVATGLLLGDLPLNAAGILAAVAGNRVYQIIILVLLITNLRHILFRLRDEEV